MWLKAFESQGWLQAEITVHAVSFTVINLILATFGLIKLNL